MRSIAFTKAGCTCPAPVFRKKYLRSHCSNGSKILRCFPHCCPFHVEGTYCGSSLAVSITSSPATVAQCAVYFRLEASYDATYTCGHTLDATTVTSDERQPSNPRGCWIVAKPVHVEGEVTTFEYDGAEGWHYGWKGGSSIHQRLSWHRIKAYVLLNNPTEPPTSWEVVGTATSPPFFVMSYRRSCKACQVSDSSNSRDGCECAGVFRLSDRLLQEVLAQGDSHCEVMPLTPRLPALVLAHPARSHEDHEMLVALIAKALSCARSQSPAALLKSLVGQFDTKRGELYAENQAAHLLPSGVIATCVDIAVGLVCDRASVHLFLQQHGGDILDQHNLWLGYEQWVSFLHTKILAILTAKSISVEAFAQALRGAGDVRPPPPTHEYSPVFLYYVAQLREVYMALDATMPHYPIESPLTGSWTLNVDSVHVDVDATAPLSVLSVLRWWTAGSRVQLVVAGGRFLARSAFALFPTQWSEFVLDNEPHIFRVFPDGETSMATADGLVHGDYVGSMDGLTGVVRLELFSWPAADSTDQNCFVVRLHIEVAAAANEVKANVQVARAPVVGDADGIEGLNPTERVQLMHDRPAKVDVARLVTTYARIE